MFKVEEYMSKLITALKANFADRLLYVGLQGSYLRGEATEKSDIDVMVILDGLDVPDLLLYKNIINSLEEPDKSCGFICGKSDIANWNTLEICNLLHSTKDYYGKLKDFVPEYTKKDVEQFVKYSVGNLYHEICHRYLHSDLKESKENLPYTYKSVFFILQSVYYLRDKVFYPTKKELIKHLSDRDREMMERAARLIKCETFDFEDEFSALMQWCQEILKEV